MWVPTTRYCCECATRSPTVDQMPRVGIFVPGKVAIGFRRLAIIDLETGDQPIANGGADVHVTCNGEIYNFRRLREELQARGHGFRSGSDTEVIAHLYEERGADCVDALQGMFPSLSGTARGSAFC